MRALRFFSWLLLLASVDLGLAQKNTPSTSSPILPSAFGGWRISGSRQLSTNAAAADPINASLLKEYGFTDFEGAIYRREDGRQLSIKAARFGDASGAYGAFTFYKTPEMLNEQIGDQGYSLNERVLFYRGSILVDAKFEKLSAMSAAELRELAAELPRPIGTTANLPGLPAYLPKDSYVKNTARYVVGPIALDKTGAPLPASLVDFDKGAEVVMGDYKVDGTPARMMLIAYPTPQIAAAEFTRIESAREAGHLGAETVSLRRTGPILVLARGALSPGDAKSLVSSVNYDADVTWNENTHFTRRDNVANLIVAIIILAAIIGGLSIVAGIAFGGFRVAVKRLFPDKVFDRPDQVEIIALHLSDSIQEPRDSA
ncbi:MAG: hypothetical protein JO356_08400 [Acidobacteria bacterium]|nr:hypothetical protein [Acidobacteriota bacterium]